MTDIITLPRAVGDEVRDLLCHADFTHFHFAAKRREMLLRAASALAALDAALEAQEDEALLNEPVAMRYDGDGYGYLYIDSGSGSDWQRRHKDAEPLYLAPPKPEPALVEQLFALAKLTVRRAAYPDPWSWDRLADDGTWTPFQPLIHGPDMWRLEQALRTALGSEMSAAGDDCRQPATVEQVIAAHGPPWGPSASPAFFSGWRAAERHHKIITMEDGK